MISPDLDALRQFVKVYDFPTDILIETIANCNLNCIMCPQDKLTRSSGKMSFELWKKIVDEISSKSPETRIWPALMGEPLLLGDDIFKMIKYAKKKGVKNVHLNSNLTIFTETMLDLLFDSQLDELVVGLDGITSEVFEKIRLGGSLHKVMENINMILDEKEKRKLSYPRVIIQFIVMDENEHEVQPFIDFWKKSNKRVSLKIRSRLGWADGVEPWKGIVNVSKDNRDLPCTWLLRQMTIFWNGIVPQCDGDYNGATNYGDINMMSLEEVWLEKLKPIRDRHMGLDFDFSPCNSCEDWQAGRSTWIECGSEE